MHKILFIAFALLAISTGVNAQKFAYVDSKYILSHVPEYSAAQQEINRLSAEWQKEVELKYTNIEKLEKAYQAEKILLTDEMRKKREEEISQKRDEAKTIQKQKFGVDGELFKKREELTKPIQDKIYEAIAEISSQSSLMVVFDKSNHSNMLYTNPKHDISEKVIKKMGFKPGETLEEEGTEEEEGDEGEKKPDGGAKDGGGKVPINSKGGTKGGGDRTTGGNKQ
ncbi:MAG: OmpH family outer membrane protein [Flavobacteriales bacterium]|nr:OmpH family outer membrane protein [Flavobacteriales bacterium]